MQVKKASSPDGVTSRWRLRLARAGLVPAWLATACGYAFIVHPGLPADEPSHWLNVLFYVHHQRLPVLGDRGVTYEARQPPLAYALATVVYLVAHAATGSLSAGFYAVRLLGVVEIGAAGLLAWRVARRAVGPARGPGLAVAAAVVMLNPMLLGMGTSVQNDALVLALGMLALDLALSKMTAPAHIADAVFVGLAQPSWLFRDRVMFVLVNR